MYHLKQFSLYKDVINLTTFKTGIRKSQKLCAMTEILTFLFRFDTFKELFSID